jgi:hypothetical protein
VSKKSVFKVLISIFVVWLILFPLNDLLFSSMNPQSRAYDPASIVATYLSKCVTGVYLLATEEVGTKLILGDFSGLNLSDCKDKRIGLRNNGELDPVFSRVEIVSSEITTTRDSKEVIVNIGWHVKKRFLFSVWGETKWTSFNGEKFVQGKSVLP